MQLIARPLRLAAFLISAALFTSTAWAQGVPGKNISLVGPTPQPASCATAPFCGGLLPDTGLRQQNEPSCAVSETGRIFCGVNDYRGAERTDSVLGDAWMGALMSRDGQTWISRLAPGFKGDGTTSLNLAYGADPILMAFPGGMMYVFIAGDRGDNGIGGVFAQRWVEVNKEDGYPFVPAVGKPQTVATGTAGRFLDKPGAMLNMLGTGTCEIPYLRSDGTPDSRTVPAFEVSVAYATFLGSNQSDGTSIWIVKSTDCGATWDTPGKKVTQTLSVNQGVTLSALGNRYLAVWRTFTDTNQPMATLAYSVSNNRGQSWSRPGELASILPFDQGTSTVTFRTTALPWAVSDGNAFHVFWSERQSASDPLARIRYSSSTNGTSWSAPAHVDNAPAGHQFIPSAASANGVTQVAWYDTRDDHTQVFGPFINDFRDASGKIRRHTADIWAIQGTWNGTSLVFTPGSAVKVSSYRTGIAPPGFGLPAGQVVRLEDNFVNSRIFKQGTVPFIGDYIAVAAKPGPVGQAPTFFVAWTDNRSLRGNTVGDLENATEYTPPLPTLQGEPDPSVPRQPCTATNDLSKTRNQEVFGALIRPGLVVTVPSASKPTGSIQRAFVVHVTNNTSQAKSYKLLITQQPPDAASGTGRASFLQSSTGPLTDADLTRCISVPRRSGAAVTVFVTSTSPTPAIVVDVKETDAACQLVTGATASVTLNQDPRAPDIENPDIENPDIENVEVHNPDIENRTVSIFSIANPDIENPDFENYTVAFPDIENPDFENPDFENFTVAYPDIENPDIENSVVSSGGSVTDVTWSVKLKGNTTSALDVQTLFATLPSSAVQLIVRRVYATPTTRSCGLVQVATNQVIVNTVSQPGETPAGSFYLAPGETALITVRMAGIVDPQTLGVNVTSQAGGASDIDPPVVDQTAPVLALPSPPPVEASGAGGAVVTYSATATDDVDGSVSVTCAPASGSLFAIGTTTVTCSASDSRGNTATGTFDVTVVDTTAPVLSGVPADVSVAATGPAGATVTFVSPTAIDGVSGAVAVSCSPASGSVFPIGATIVTCTASDAAGNGTSASFTVTVSDTAAPVISGHADVIAEATGPSGATVTYTAPAATDNVGVVSVSCAPASGSAFPLGTTVVTCTARDAADLTAVTTFSVTVVDTSAPVISPHADVSAIATGTGSTIVTYTNPTATDLVDGAVAVTCSPASGSGFALGSTTIVCTAVDQRQNQATSSFQVKVGLGFVGLLSPWRQPPPIYTVNLGSSVPVGWEYTNASGAIMDTSAVVPTVTFTLLTSCSGGTETSTTFVNEASAGNSFFQYSNGTWQFNWQTKPPVVAGCYNIRVILGSTGQTNGPFLMRLR